MLALSAASFMPATSGHAAALTAGPGVYNIVDDDPLSVAGWLPAVAQWIDAPPPPRASENDAWQRFGEEAVF